MKKFFFLIVISSCLAYGQDSLYKWVNPLIGTGGHGHTYPGVSEPFGMIQLSPDTRLDGWDGCGGYHHSDSVIYGFSHTHLSGTGVSDYGDVLIMPFIGKNEWSNGYPTGNNGYGTSFSHNNEKAAIGKYHVKLNNQIEVELTTTLRCGMHRYTYPKWEKKKVIIDLTHRDKLLGSDLILLNDSTLIGKRISSAWANEQHVYFMIRFSEAAVKTAFRKNEKEQSTQLILEFGHVNPELLIQVGISSTDIAGAKRNLKAEMPHWNFESYVAQNQEKWNQELAKVTVSGKENDQIIFYSALYHSFLNPNTFSDVDGRYRGMDGEIHKTNSEAHYTIFSLWDTFRATHPLFTLTQTHRTNDFIKTLLLDYQQGGKLPIWKLSSDYTGCMIGYHAIPVIADAYIKGLRDFDTELALKAMLNSAEQDHLGLKDYKKQGYISSENESESVSKTLEYAYDDWCIALFADSLGYDSLATAYYLRAQNYKNLLHPYSKFMQPRYNGGWKSNFIPEEVTFDYTEANAWQYSLFTPQDTDGLIHLLGGRDSLQQWLDRLFTVSSATKGRHQADITGLIGQYAHGNEPSHHMAYLYNFTKAPWKGQYYLNKIMNTLYTNAPDGLSGNEDCGQMSAWYVLSSLGIYSFAPGSDVYLTGTPLFDSATVNLENGNTFRIYRENYTEENIYVKSITLNGEKLNRNFIYHNEITEGGKLVFTMTSEKNEFNGVFPSSEIKDTTLLTSPYIVDPTPSFEKKRKVVLDHPNENVIIRYTLDGNTPNENAKKYKKPIKIKSNTTLKAKAFAANGISKVVSAKFIQGSVNWKINLTAPYANQYAAGGKRALIDHITGGDDFRTGAWQGYLGTDLGVELDLQKKRKINHISIRFLQDIRSWIWLPAEVRFMTSTNGKDWFTFHTVKSKLSANETGAHIETFEYDGKMLKTRYLKIVAVNRGQTPTWHLSPGNDSWMFSDEIQIQEK